MNQHFLFFIASLVLFASCGPEAEKEPLAYPETATVDTVDVYFGVEVQDPYRWLEDDMSEATEAWVKTQNALTFDYLEQIPFRDAFFQRMENVADYERVYAPRQHGDYLYYYKNSGLQNHNVLYRKKPGSDEEEVFLDPNSWSEDGTISLAGTHFTKDGSLVCFLISEGGSDWRKAIVMETETMDIVGDTLNNLKFTNIAWDSTAGFYYSSYELPDRGSQLSGMTDQHRLIYHKLGTAQIMDEVIFGQQEKRRYIQAATTEDGRFLIIGSAQSTTGEDLHYIDLEDPKREMVTLVDNFDYEYTVLQHYDGHLIVETNYEAPRRQVVKIDLSQPDPADWETLIPETEHVLNASAAAGKIFARYLVDVKPRVIQYHYDGKKEREIDFEAIGSVNGFGGKEDDSVTYYTFSSFNDPSTIYAYDPSTGESSIYERPEVSFNPDDFIVKQEFYESKDGTRIPMFIAHRKDIEPSAETPLLLYGYGGFNISLTPGFSVSRFTWMDAGGIYVVANLRGGGEYGEDWHLSGTKMKKQNVFDDFIAAAEYLIDKEYTSSGKLTIMGGSNGGLLVGASLTQRPDLMHVALPFVGVLDMLRYHKFTAGAGWAYDYGTSEESQEMFEYLYGYSPVHNVKEGTAYPATMVLTGDHDDRVVPAHSFKFAATLQAHQGGHEPILLRVTTDAGHGAGKALSTALREISDAFTFAWYEMDATPEFAE